MSRPNPRLFRRSAVACALALVLALAGASRALALTATCNPANPTANTTNVLCAGSSTCTTGAGGIVTVKENIDVTSGGCDFDLGARALIFTKTFQMTGAGYIKVTNATTITISATGKLKARGDFVLQNGIIIQGGMISLTGTGLITAQNGALVDVSGDPAGTITFTTSGNDGTAQALGINLANGTELRGNGQSSFTDAGDRFTDGGTVSLTATTGGIFDSAAINLAGANQGEGGEVDMVAARTITIAQPIDTHGGGGDGGTIDFTAGDNILVSKTIDVSSTVGGGFGGDLSLAAGEDTVGVPGGVVGGALTLDAANNAQLKANGSDLETTGGDGGDIELSAQGHPGLCAGGANVGHACQVNSECPSSTCAIQPAINVTADNGFAIQASGGPLFDGSGGTVFMDTGDFDPNTFGTLDGDISINAGINASGGGDAGDGGEVDISAGGNLTITGPITMTGEDSGGDLSGDSGGTTLLNGILDVHASGATGEAGSIDFISGLAKGGPAGAFTLAKNVVATAGTQNGGSESVSFAGCTMTVNGTVKVDGTGGVSVTNISGGADIEFASVGAMLFSSGAQILAPPAGTTTLTHPTGVVPQRSGATFNPQPIDNPVVPGSAVLPNCPVCGDNIVQVGEVCDKGAGAQGACCNGTCTAFLCATATPTPTATRSRTPTPTSTPGAPVATATRTATPVPTLTATAVVTATRTATPVLATPTATLTVVAATATRTATPTPALTATATATATRTATVTPTSTSTVTPTPTVTATPTVTRTTTPLPGATATLTASPTVTASATPTASLTATATVTATLTATATVTATATPVVTATATATPTVLPTATVTATVGATATATVTATATATAVPTVTATATATAVPTVTVSATPTVTATPTVSATLTPSAVVTRTATPSATATLTASATVTPVATPTVTATRSATPSATRSLTPSPSPTTTPSGAPSTTPTPQSNPLTAKAADKCQRAITKAGSVFMAKRLKSLDKCANGVLRCVQEKATDATCLPKATVTCNDELIGTLASLQSDFQDAVASKCEDVGLTIADLLDTDTLGFANVQNECATLGSPLAGIADVSACILAQHECTAEQLFELQEPRAGEMIDRVRAQGGTFAPLTCLTDHGPAGATADPKTLGKAVDKCEAQAKASGTKFLVAQLRALTTCAASVLTCDLTQPGDSTCLAKASSSCTKGLAKIDTEADKVGPAVDKRCGAAAINFDALRAATGANLVALAEECAGLGVPAINSIADYETCLIRQHTCNGEDLTRFEVPRAEELLGAITPPATLHSPFCPSAVQ
ncbi:MAG TPA: hypothetical protein VGK30_19385 [Candidatus Binatia bacterium]|jgi:hypothetical protein